jgi:hypothetical protein
MDENNISDSLLLLDSALPRPENRQKYFLFRPNVIVICISRPKTASFVRVRVFWPRRSRGLKTGEDKRDILAVVHMKFFRRPQELQTKRHHWENYKFILYLPFSNMHVEKCINTY